MGRTLPWDWYGGTIPDNAFVDETAYVETTFSFFLYRSTAAEGLRIGRGASTYLGTMFDVGPGGRVTLGDFSLVHGARLICDAAIEIGDYALISWNVVVMDNYRAPLDPDARRSFLESFARGDRRAAPAADTPRPVRIGNNVWIGFDSCILPGVTIADGSVVGARSVVVDDVPPYSVVAGNPARIIRSIQPGDSSIS